MKPYLINIAALIVAGLCLPLNADDASEYQPRRVSIVDVGMDRKVPAALIDLLYVELSKQSDVVLLERENIDRLLREQRTALFEEGGDRDSAVAVQAGKIWATDVFLMLESVTDGTKLPSVRVRLVDAWYGLKIYEYNFLEPSGDDFKSTAALMARNAYVRMSAVKRDASKMQLVGVMGVESISLSREWDYLADMIGLAIEQSKKNCLCDVYGLPVAVNGRIGSHSCRRVKCWARD